MQKNENLQKIAVNKASVDKNFQKLSVKYKKLFRSGSKAEG